VLFFVLGCEFFLTYRMKWVGGAKGGVERV